MLKLPSHVQVSLRKRPEFDVIITAESKGNSLAYEMARQAGNKPYIVARKWSQIYMDDS